jgi:hypothetical protein
MTEPEFWFWAAVLVGIAIVIVAACFAVILVVALRGMASNYERRPPTVLEEEKARPRPARPRLVNSPDP